MTTQTEALNIAIDYMNERLEEHDAKYQRHPTTEAERNNILADIETVKEALAQQEGQSNYCLQCEALSRELAALKAQQNPQGVSNEQVEPVAKAWSEGYRQGIEDERTSEENIGIAGFGAKVEPNRENPYTHPPVPNAKLTAQPELKTCNCRWDGEVQVQQCTLHESHVDAVHEWAERAKTAEAKLKVQPKEPEQEPVALPDDFELLPVDPTPEMKSAAIEVELFDHDTGKDYMLSWEEAEQIYSAMLNAAPTPPQRKLWVSLSDEQIDDCRYFCPTPLPQSTASDYVDWHKKTHVRAFARNVESKLRELNEATQRKPLTDEQIDSIADKFTVHTGEMWEPELCIEFNDSCKSVHSFARAIEAAHGIKE